MSCVGDVLNFVKEYQRSSSGLYKCNSFIKRTAKIKDGDFSTFWCISVPREILCQELDGLLEESRRKSWQFSINSYDINRNRISLKLLRSSVIKSIFLEISQCKFEYGKSTVFVNQSYKICCTESGDSLTKLRMSVAVRVLSALVTMGSGSIADDGQTVQLSQTANRSQSILVRPVKMSAEFNVSEEEFLKLRTEDVLATSDHKHMNEQLVRQIVDAAVTFELLSVRLEKPLVLDLSIQPTAARKSNNKGAPFVLYNYARLCAILERFDQCVAKGAYQPLPSLHDIDYNLFTEEDEWSLVFDLLADWPSVVLECQNLNSPALHRLTAFLACLASRFSVYYRHTRVLNEGLPHMVPMMVARIHLLLSIKQVFQIGFSILGINAPTTM